MKTQSSKSRITRVSSAFTLIELLVAVSVVTMMVLILGQLLGHATTVTRAGGKHIDTDTQARTVLDRMAIDLAQMLKRTDVDYYLKGSAGYTGHGNGHAYGNRVASGQLGSDQIAFFSRVQGYYPATGGSIPLGSPISLVAYRINSHASSPAYLRMQRMGKGLLWNGVSNATVSNPNNRNSRDIVYPIVFVPGQIAPPGGGPPTGPWAGPWGPWAAAITNDTSGNLNNSGSQDADYEIIAPSVFRFEYYYLLKNGLLTDVPWDQNARSTQTSLTTPTSIGLVDVEAIGVAIAVIDSTGRTLISDSSLFDVASDLADFKSANGRGVGGQKKVGDLEASWETALKSIIAAGKTSNNSFVSPAATSAIRIYGRYFDLKTLPAF